jgi:spermidine synthase
MARVRVGDGEVVVRERDGFREMAPVGKGAMVWTRCSLSHPAESGWPYVDLFHLAATLALARNQALFIGFGGAVALRQFAAVYPGIAMDLVEHEPAVVALAREWFDLATIPGVDVHIDDGLAFVEKAAAATWDVAIVDAYGSSKLAEGLAERTFFAALRRVLRPGGAMALNVVGKLVGAGPVRAVVAATAAEFDSIRLVPVVTADEEFSATATRNVVVVARCSTVGPPRRIP